MFANLYNYLTNNINTIIYILLFLIIVILTSFVIYNVYKHYKYLNTLDDEEEIDDEYTATTSLGVNMDNLLKFTIRKYVKYYKFVLHYIHFYIIKFVAGIQSVFDYIYSKLRDSFVEKSIGDKKYVAHFWNNLKEFKKEKEKEKEVEDNL